MKPDFPNNGAGSRPGPYGMELHHEWLEVNSAPAKSKLPAVPLFHSLGLSGLWSFESQWPGWSLSGTLKDQRKLKVERLHRLHPLPSCQTWRARKSSVDHGILRWFSHGKWGFPGHVWDLRRTASIGVEPDGSLEGKLQIGNENFTQGEIWPLYLQ